MAELPKEITITVKVDPALSQILVAQIALVIAEDKEGKIRQALIDMGWTPPPLVPKS